MIKEGNGMGIAGFVLGLISLLTFFVFFISPVLAILGIIFSGIQIKKSSNTLAFAGLILSILGLLAASIFILFLIFAISQSDDFAVDEVNQTVVLITNSYEYLSENKLYTGKMGGSGVIYYNDEGKMRIITNRHVSDCSQSEYCGQLVKQKITVRTYDGKLYNVTKIYTSPNGMDLAILEIETKENYSLAKISNQINKNEKVVAIGYPGFSSNAREFSIGFGKITSMRNLITPEGYDFKAIDSSAYINFGSSGGGLFNEKGELIGITTWGDGENSYAINIDHLGELALYAECSIDEYYVSEKGCIPLCEGAIGKNNECVLPCKDFYCNSDKINANDDRCNDNSLILGNDGFCHNACGDKGSYCPGEFSYCYENKCSSCPNGYNLFEDGLCYAF